MEAGTKVSRKAGNAAEGLPMNRERAKELLPILEAYANGEDIEFRGNYSLDPIGEWVSMPEDERMSMQFPRDDYEYRIKPSPREWWINIYRNTGHSHTVHSSKELAIKFADSHVKETIKLREVLK